MSGSRTRDKVAAWVLGVGMRIFTKEELRIAWRKLENPALPIAGKMQYIAYTSLLMADKTGVIQPLVSTLRRRSLASMQETIVYDELHLDARLNRIYDLPSVILNPERPRTINILVPAFDFNSISAGFFGVFQTALFASKATPYKVRLVLFDNFFFDLQKAREKIKRYPGMQTLFDDLEVDYIGDRSHPLEVSADDTCLATVWYSAFFAHKIMATINTEKPFLYLIQDYETNFYPGSSSSVVANQSYRFNYSALFSSKSLQDFFVNNDIGGIVARGVEYMHFNNACAANLMEEERFMQIHQSNPKRRLVFYSRPVVDRNMFELTAKAILTAFRTGLFSTDQWECIGMGLGECTLRLNEEEYSVCMPRMSLEEYIESVASFDVCLTLMASPHPSLIPMDLAGSGAVVVTNTFATKTEAYLRSLSDNIIPADPTLEGLLAALERAKEASLDLPARYKAAADMRYPRNWDETFTEEHRQFLLTHC
jgi:hypothetical protein